MPLSVWCSYPSWGKQCAVHHPWLPVDHRENILVSHWWWGNSSMYYYVNKQRCFHVWFCRALQPKRKHHLKNQSERVNGLRTLWGQKGILALERKLRNKQRSRVSVSDVSTRSMENSRVVHARPTSVSLFWSRHDFEETINEYTAVFAALRLH